MRAGNFNKKIQFFADSVTTNEYGEAVQDYKYLFEVRAYIPRYSGSRYEQNDEIFNNYRRDFIVHSYIEVTETMLIRYENKFWRILSIIKDDTNKELLIQTELFNE